ncbi:hypothetical protein N7448_010174 [Penicillium atrosanguineum]|uniref:Uncharacterized protein n=1 Tax=Penicillium atrosanguineum TaxID=1132637 RepID=A0A9W9GFJ0_9EURO|nr:uncharacterized protein N7443_007398 [Penicillium atrosanguineum]KAJ5118467.1 hypothetical protein N7526_010104 [Penicillium atrosanguineum]KAJ5119505.1 hypothetical protein N7448_010174 [Penicillium atrosanguineum]KAJ5296505.1 hypothetical protein N7443_007398 [Penicillium atrosanguineum]KAJ5299270.1 hypothetical protein N7476_010827 [Penicillium atrosanguineum]
MHFNVIAAHLAGLLAIVSAKDSRTFAVNHFYGQGPLTEGRMDPIISPGTASSHVHAIQGGSNFNLTMENDALLDSSCTSSLVEADKSNYWTPSLYFQDPTNGSFISVPMFYMNVYYFFEPTDDEIKPFPVGLRMVSGNNSFRTPPPGGAANVLDTNAGTIQPVQWTCPRSSYDTPSYPTTSDGLHGVGIQDPNNKGAGAGFPDMNCDGYASPLRADIHFPSCYNPKAGLDAYETNTVFPSSKGTTGGKANCPEGWTHLPHIFYEVYWNTPLFAEMWEQGQGSQPFILASGDRTGYSLHGDFIAGWDVDVLQKIIENCDAGDSGMDKCADAGTINNSADSCNIANLIPEKISGVLDKLPGNNPPTGWGQGETTSPDASQSASSQTTTSVASTSNVETETESTTTSKAPATETGIASWSYLGCYSDNTSTRALTGVQFANLGIGKVTSTGCMEYCDNAGFSLAGTEYAGQCFCGNKMNGNSKITADKCNMKCEGDASQVCGGSSALSVYEKAAKAESKRANAHFRRHMHGKHT